MFSSDEVKRFEEIRDTVAKALDGADDGDAVMGLFMAACGIAQEAIGKSFLEREVDQMVKERNGGLHDMLEASWAISWSSRS